MEWTEERVERLHGLAKEGRSSREIAERLSSEFGETVSKSAVIGKAYREGIRLPLSRSDGPKMASRRVKKKRGATDPKPHKPQKIKTTARRLEGEAFIMHDREITSAGQDAIGCRYIEGHVDKSLDGWRYCQRATDGGGYFCDAHRAVMTQKRGKNA